MRIACALMLLFSASMLCAAESKSSATSSDEKGFTLLFDGKTLNGWVGATKGYVPKDGALVCDKGGNLFTAEEYSDFIFRFEFKLPPHGNNGIGIRCPFKKNAPAYNGIEIQVLDTPSYKKIKPYQAHGSIYGVVPAKTGFLKPVGQWNKEEIRCQGEHFKVTLNGKVIVDADLSKIDKTMDGREHPGLHNKKGHIGFLGHGARVEFRNIRIKRLDVK